MADLPEEKPSKAVVEARIASKLPIMAHLPLGHEELALESYANQAYPDGSATERDEFKRYWRERLDRERERWERERDRQDLPSTVPRRGNSIQKTAKEAMPDKPFSDTEIHDKTPKANAIQRVKVRWVAWYRRLQRELWAVPSQTGPSEWPSESLPIRRFAQAASQGPSCAVPENPPSSTQPVKRGNPEANARSAGDCGVKAQKWEDIEILFLSDERVQITSGDRTETRNYGELGFVDRRAGKPNEGWGVLRALARGGGSIPNSVRNSRDFVAMAKRIQRMRKRLMEHFGIPSDPVPLDPVKGYCCRFKIRCAPSFEK